MIDINTVITAASIITAVITIFTVIFSAYKWYLKQNKQDEEIKKIKEEQCMHTYVLLAVLDGLKQLKCNGKVTEAQDKLSKHVNKVAHDVED